MSRQRSHLTTLLKVLPIDGRAEPLLQIVCQNAAVVIAVWLLCSGSYTSPFTHNQCSSTSSFRATAGS